MKKEIASNQIIGSHMLFFDPLNKAARFSNENGKMCLWYGYTFVEGEEPDFFPGDFDRELTYDCIPFIDNKYRTMTDRENRAIAGLSLGSTQAFYSAMKHPDGSGHPAIG